MKKLLVLVMFLVAPQVFAQTTHDHEHPVVVTGSDTLMGVLRVIDVVPTRLDLEKIPNVQDQMRQIAGDASHDTYIRIRAVTLLSHWPTQENLVALETLATSADAQVRSKAIYTVGRAFGPVFAARATSLVEVGLKDSNKDVREWSARALRWIPGEAADVVLKRLVDDPSLGQIARRAQRYRN